MKYLIDIQETGNLNISGKYVKEKKLIFDSFEVEIPMVGEGVVYKARDGKHYYRFKVKGEKHSASKVKKLAPVVTEKLKSVMDFVDYAVTENRLEQGIDVIFTQNNEEPDVRKLGDYLKWIMSDIIAEEMDTLNDNGLEPKDVGKSVSTKAREWFFKKYR